MTTLFLSIQKQNIVSEKEERERESTQLGKQDLVRRT